MSHEKPLQPPARPARSAVLLSSLAFLSLLLGAPLAAWLLLARGAPASLVVGAFVAGEAVLILLLERAFPYEPAWNRARGDLQTDVVNAISVKLPDIVARGAGTALKAGLAVALAGSLGRGVWPSHLPFVAQVLLVLVPADLAKYWLHRLGHEHPTLWRFHAVHHGPSRVYSLNGFRVHPINHLWNFFFDVTVPIALGAGPMVLAVASVARAMSSLLQHANIALYLGPLNKVFSTPVLHRWHHSTELLEANTNYGSMLIIWDVLFGTYYQPADRPHPATLGLADGATLPEGFAGQLAWPFCQERLATTCFTARIRGLLR
jgi:sterol desaturase/sphingolipid hydroxylase (fatty acid hydroxylase superfamily)